MRRRRKRSRKRQKRIKYKRLTKQQQIGAGFGALLRSLPRVLRSVGPKLGALTRGARGRSGLAGFKRRARGFGKSAKKIATGKNLKKAAKIGGLAAVTGAISGGASHLIQRLLRGQDDDE